MPIWAAKSGEGNPERTKDKTGKGGISGTIGTEQDETDQDAVRTKQTKVGRDWGGQNKSRCMGRVFACGIVKFWKSVLSGVRALQANVRWGNRSK